MLNYLNEVEIDLSILHQEAREELINFYVSLVKDYTAEEYPKKSKKKDFLKNFLPKPVKKFAPLKREKIYVR